MSTGSAHDEALPARPDGSPWLPAPLTSPAAGPSSSSSSTARGTSRLRAEAESLRGGSPAAERGGRPAEAALAGERTRSWPLASTARGLALFLGAFTLLNLAGTLRVSAFDPNIWWVAPPSVPRPVSLCLFAAVGAALVAYAAAPRMAPWRRWVTVGLCAAFAAMAVVNMVDFYRVWRHGLIRPWAPVPLSLVVAVALGFVAWAAVRPQARPRRRWPAAAVLLATATVCVVVFPPLQVLFFGSTDYRRPADVAVVFGAQVHNNGVPSASLRDRMATAEQLYRQGLVKRLIVSGGVGTSGYNEALVMRDMAIAAGVPRKAVIVDSDGVDTDATVAHTVPFFTGSHGRQRVLAVSQFYHLPRIKLAYQRAGWNVLTVPSGRGDRGILPYMIAREVPAFWLYYARAVAR